MSFVDDRGTEIWTFILFCLEAKRMFDKQQQAIDLFLCMLHKGHETPFVIVIKHLCITSQGIEAEIFIIAILGEEKF